MVPTRARALLWPAMMAFTMFVVLLALGSWQIERLAWKEAILARIDRAEHGPAVPLPADPAPFAKVRVSGRFLPGREALYGVSVRETPSGSVMGADLIAPLQRADGSIVLVDRGWVPTPDEAVPFSTPPGDATIEGFIRPPARPSLISAGDEPARRQFFTLDPQRIGKAIGLSHVDNFTVVAMGQAEPDRYPIPASEMPRPPNNHLQYALTWFALAAALVGVFISWARTRLSM